MCSEHGHQRTLMCLDLPHLHVSNSVQCADVIHRDVSKMWQRCSTLAGADNVAVHIYVQRGCTRRTCRFASTYSHRRFAGAEGGKQVCTMCTGAGMRCGRFATAICAQTANVRVTSVKRIRHISMFLSHMVLANMHLSMLLRSICTGGLYFFDCAQCAKRHQYAKQRNGSLLNAMCDITSRITGA